MESQALHVATNVVQDDDLEEFCLKLSEAITKCSASGLPSIAFSHTANANGGYNYVAIVHGVTDPNREVVVHDLRDTE
jgi:hypothetical protein